MTRTFNDLIDALRGHSVSTVHSRGWAGTTNGALLKRADGVIDAFVTMDTNLEHQQNVSALSFGIVVVNAPSNRIQDLTPLVPVILNGLNKVRPGTVEHVGRGRKRMDRSTDI